MIFRQLFEPVSSTYTYVLGCHETGEAIPVDPVVNSIDKKAHGQQDCGAGIRPTTLCRVGNRVHPSR